MTLLSTYKTFFIRFADGFAFETASFRSRIRRLSLRLICRYLRWQRFSRRLVFVVRKFWACEISDPGHNSAVRFVRNFGKIDFRDDCARGSLGPPFVLTDDQIRSD